MTRPPHGSSRPSPGRAGGTLTAESRPARPSADEPLAASWDPFVEPPRSRTRRPRRGLRGFAATYGWRAYALPVLTVLTLLVGIDALQSPAPGAASGTDRPGAGAGTDSSGSSAVPLIPNPTPGPVVRAPTESAALPGGGSFTATGTGKWTVVPGSGPRVGAGQLFTYTVEVEDGVVLPGGPEGFAATVDATLSNPKSWIGSGRYALQRISDSGAANVRVTLTSQQTVRAICGFAIPFDASCWKGDTRQAVLNTARWARGATAFQGNVVEYQQYVINHEVGHGLGFPHTPCQDTGQLAPVMMQQTWGTSNDYLAALGTDNVRADGKVCKANAWPFPVVP